MTTVLTGTRKAINNWLRQFKTFIDLENKTYKIQESLLGIFKWGNFMPLPKINYVLVFKNVFAKDVYKRQAPNHLTTNCVLLHRR